MRITGGGIQDVIRQTYSPKGPQQSPFLGSSSQASSAPHLLKMAPPTSIRFGAITPDEKNILIEALHNPDFLIRTGALQRILKEDTLKDPDIMRVLARHAAYEDVFQEYSNNEVRRYNRLLSLKTLEKYRSPWGAEASLLSVREQGDSKIRIFSGLLMRHLYPVLPQWVQQQFRPRMYDFIINNGGSANEECERALREQAPLADVPFIWTILTRDTGNRQTGLLNTPSLNYSTAARLSNIMVTTLAREKPQALTELMNYWVSQPKELPNDVFKELGLALGRLGKLLNTPALLKKTDAKAMYAFLTEYEARFREHHDKDFGLKEDDLIEFYELKRRIISRLPEAEQAAISQQLAQKVLRDQRLEDLCLLTTLLVKQPLPLPDLYEKLKPTNGFSPRSVSVLRNITFSKPTLANPQETATFSEEVAKLSPRWMDDWENAVKAIAQGNTKPLQPFVDQIKKLMLLDLDATATKLLNSSPEALKRATRTLAKELKADPTERNDRRWALLLNLALGKEDRTYSFVIDKVLKTSTGRWRNRSSQSELDKLINGNMEGLLDLKKDLIRQFVDKSYPETYFESETRSNYSSLLNTWQAPIDEWPTRATNNKPRGYQFSLPKSPELTLGMPSAPEPSTTEEQTVYDTAINTANDPRISSSRDFEPLAESLIRQWNTEGNKGAYAAIKTLVQKPQFAQAFIANIKVNSWRSPETLLGILQNIAPAHMSTNFAPFALKLHEIAKHPAGKPYQANCQKLILEAVKATANDDSSSVDALKRLAFPLLRYGLSENLLQTYRKEVAQVVNTAISTRFNIFTSDLFTYSDKRSEISWGETLGVNTSFMDNAQDGTNPSRRLDVMRAFELMLRTKDLKTVESFTQNLVGYWQSINNTAYADENFLIGFVRNPEYIRLALQLDNAGLVNQLSNIVVWYRIFEAIPPFIEAASEQMKRGTQLSDPINLQALALSLSTMGYLGYPEASALQQFGKNQQIKDLAEQFIQLLETPNHPLALFGSFPRPVPFLNNKARNQEPAPTQEPGKKPTPSVPVTLDWERIQQLANQPAEGTKPPAGEGTDKKPLPFVPVYIPGLIGLPPDDPLPNLGKLSAVIEALRRYENAEDTQKPIKLQTMVTAAKAYSKAAARNEVPFARVPEKLTLAQNIGQLLQQTQVRDVQEALLDILIYLAEPSVTAPVVDLINDRALPETLLLKAFNYIRESGPPESLAGICMVYATESERSLELKRAALDTLTQIGNATNLLSFNQTLQDSSESVLPLALKAKIVEDVGRIGYGNTDAINWMLELISSSIAPRLKQAAIEGFGMMMDGEAEYLENFVGRVTQNEPREVKIAALSVLDGRNWTSPVEAFVNRLRQDTDFFVRDAASRTTPAS